MVVVTDRQTSVSAKRCRRQQGRVRFVSPGVSLRLVLVLSACLAADTANAANCDEASGAAAISACEKELARDPTNIEVRLRYADVLMGQQQYQKAVNILSDTLAMRPGSETIKRKYRLASSLAEEQQSIEGLSVDTPAVGTRNSVKEILCKSLKGQRAIDACDEVLTTDPRNVTALIRRGDELMALNRVKDAVVSYRHAVALDPANPTLKNKLTRAESKMPEESPTVVVEAPIVEVPIIDEEEMRLAEEKRKADEVKRMEETKKRLLAEQEQKRKADEVKRMEETKKRLLAEQEQKRKADEIKREEEAKKLLLAELAQKRKEAELMAKLETSPPEVVAKYSNASLANGSTY